jgi:hypothetical protein
MLRNQARWPKTSAAGQNYGCGGLAQTLQFRSGGPCSEEACAGWRSRAVICHGFGTAEGRDGRDTQAAGRAVLEQFIDGCKSLRPFLSDFK